MKQIKNFLLMLTAILSVGLITSCKKSKPVTPTPPLPPANLVAHWQLDGNAVDASRYGNNGTAIGTTAIADRFGKPNGALQFDGTSSYIVVPDSVRLRLGNTDFTLNLWVKSSAYNSAAVSALISKRITGANNGWLWGLNGALNTNLGPLGSVYYGPGGGNSDAVGTTAVALNQWTMVTCVYTLSTQTLTIYINGTLDNSTTGIKSPNSSISAPLYIGTDQLAPGQQEYFFAGAMDDIRIYNTALSQSDISQLHSAAN